MTNKTIDELLTTFDSGSIPTGEDFANLIRLCYNVNPKYKVVEREFFVNLAANANVIPITDIKSDIFDKSVISVYQNGQLLSKFAYSAYATNGYLRLFFDPIPTLRNFMVIVTYVEETKN